MPLEEIKSLERRSYEECNKGEVAAMAMLDELFADDVVWHSATGRDIHGLDSLKQSFGDAYRTFPDSHFTLDDMVVEGDKAATRFAFTGTHRSGFGGIAPTNKKVNAWAISIARIAEGKFIEVWERYDTLGWMRELGLAPRPGERK